MSNLVKQNNEIKINVDERMLWKKLTIFVSRDASVIPFMQD